MRRIINDYRRERFTRWEMVKYGILYPVGLVLACGVAGWLGKGGAL